MDNATLELTIRQLIDSQREGEYWDFKASPHTNKARLLHDLLCLANALHPGPRYLILGVQDPSQGTTICGLQPNGPSRKTQANYLDFLRGQQFVGGIRPEMELRQLDLDGKEVDVLVLFDNPYKPYCLLEDYRDQGVVVRAHYVYTRVGDINTSLDKSADLPHLERMWRQRFGLDIVPAERMQLLLRQPEQWVKDLDNQRHAYHRLFPEYQIKFSSPKPLQEPYSYFFININSFWGKATFKYHTTKILELNYVYLDEMRLLLPEPSIQHVDFSNQMQWFYYYDINSIAGSFLSFLTAEQPTLTSRGATPPFLLFTSQSERQNFIAYLIANEALLTEIIPSSAARAAEQALRTTEYNPVIRPVDLSRINDLYTKWRASTDVAELF
jgi:hypothetical protein